MKTLPLPGVYGTTPLWYYNVRMFSILLVWDGNTRRLGEQLQWFWYSLCTTPIIICSFTLLTFLTHFSVFLYISRSCHYKSFFCLLPRYVLVLPLRQLIFCII